MIPFALPASPIWDMCKKFYYNKIRSDNNRNLYLNKIDRTQNSGSKGLTI